jgi:hypothetical protein
MNCSMREQTRLFFVAIFNFVQTQLRFLKNMYYLAFREHKLLTENWFKD